MAEKRRTGKTTRKVDRAIQDLFTNEYAYLYDGRSSNIKNHTEVLEVFKRRMLSEHNHINFNYRFANHDGVHCWKIELHNL